MSTFNRYNKNNHSNVNQRNISLVNTFLNTKLKQSPYIKSVKLNKNLNIKQHAINSSHFTLNDKYKKPIPSIKNNIFPNNTKEITTFSSSEKTNNEDIQEKFNQYLKKLNNITTQFKSFKEQTQPLKDNKLPFIDNIHSKGHFLDKADSNNENKTLQVGKDISNNTDFTFKDLEFYNDELRKKQFKLLKNIDIEPITINNNKDKNATINNSTDGFFMNQTENNFLDKLENVIETKLNLIISRFIPYFTTISTELRNITDKLKDDNSNLIKLIEEKLQHLENNISNLTKTTDINSLELENLQDKLKFNTLNDLLDSLNNINGRINNLFLKYENENQESLSLLTKVNNLEVTFNNTLKSYSEKLEDKLNKLNSNIISNNELNKNDLLNNVKDIFKIFSNSPDATTMLEKSLSAISLKQDDLLKTAMSIKEQLLNNSKDMSLIKDSSREHYKIFKLVKDLQSNQNATEEQNSFNEKIHKDMEIIKKNIIKLMQDQQLPKENNFNNKNMFNESKNADYNKIIKGENTQKQFTANNQYEAKANDTSNTKYTNENNNKSSKIQETITKLKGALDLEDTLVEDCVNKEDFNKASKSESNKVTKNYHSPVDSDNSANINNFPNKLKENSQDKKEQNNPKKTSNSYNSVFVLDNSKFFK